MADPLYTPDMTYNVKTADVGKYIKVEITGDDKVMSKGPLFKITTTAVTVTAP